MKSRTFSNAVLWIWLSALRQQREAITEKRQRLDLAIQAIERAEYVVGTSKDHGWETFVKIIEVINMQADMNWSKKYYSEEAQKEIEQRAATIPREVIEQAQRDWAILIKEVDAAVAGGEDPASEKSQALAARWSELIKGFTGGNQEIQTGLNKMYADRNNWPASMPKPFSDEVQTFIVEAMKHRKKNEPSCRRHEMCATRCCEFSSPFMGDRANIPLLTELWSQCARGISQVKHRFIGHQSSLSPVILEHETA